MQLKRNNKIKQLLPPLLLEYIKDFRNYFFFQKYKLFIKKNHILKDKHLDKRCFILGSGPSIKNQNLKLLKNEIVFALNNFYVHHDFNEIVSGDSEKYYMTAPIHRPQTQNEWEAWFSDMEKKIPENVSMIFGLNREKTNIKYILNKNNFFTQQKKYWYFTGKDVNEFYVFDWKDLDIARMIWISETVSIYAIIFAIYMGFSEIYLLGMDHNYICNKEKDFRFYENGIHQKNEEERILKGSSGIKHMSKGLYKIFNQYELIKINTSRKIFNISNNSILDIFDYVNLRDVIKS